LRAPEAFSYPLRRSVCAGIGVQRQFSEKL